jgi:hypothetical protein
MTVGPDEVVAFIIPLVSWFRACGRIQKSQKISGATQRCSGILSILCLFFSVVYVQSQLDKGVGLLRESGCGPNEPLLLFRSTHRRLQKLRGVSPHP